MKGSSRPRPAVADPRIEELVKRIEHVERAIKALEDAARDQYPLPVSIPVRWPAPADDGVTCHACGMLWKGVMCYSCPRPHCPMGAGPIICQVGTDPSHPGSTIAAA